MYRPITLKTFCAGLMATILAACGGGGSSPPTPPPAPTPAVTLSLSAATATVVAGNSTTVTATIVRSGGFTGAVTIAATGAPTGVTVTGGSIDAAATTQIITIASTTNATVGNATLSITGTATGVTITPASLTLTVTAPPPPPGVTLILSSSSATVVAGNSTTATATITRTNGFAGAVTIAATGAPTGVTVTGGTIAAGSTSQVVTIATTAGATLGAATLSITAAATGVTSASQPLALTVTAPVAGITQIGTDITGAELNFGSAMALSSDGTRLVVGANGGGSANGTTRVYQRSGSTWTQLGADIVGEGAGDFAGIGVDINAAGTRIAIGAIHNDGAVPNGGHVRVYDLVGGVWTQVGADIDGTHTLGYRVALSASGNRLVACAFEGGAVRVFDLVAGAWTQVGATLTYLNDFTGGLDISADGSTIAHGSPSAAGSGRIGTALVYRLVGGAWTQVGNELTGVRVVVGSGDGFGVAVALNSDGSRIAVSAPDNQSGSTPGFPQSKGAVSVFDLVGTTWNQLGGTVFGSTTTLVAGVERFGETVSMSDDGTRWVANRAGLSTASVYSLTSGAWVQTGADITRTNTSVARSEGLALSPDGKTVAVGFINGNPKRVSVFGITP
jgi:hypothetical protein